MRHRTVQIVLMLMASLLLGLLCFPFSPTVNTLAQGNGTDQRQTIDALVLQRFVSTKLKQFDTSGTMVVIYRTITQAVPSLTARYQTDIARFNRTLTALPAVDHTATAWMVATVDKAFIEARTATAIAPTPPPLKSNTYLDDRSVVSKNPCGPPCFHGITLGKTTFDVAVKLLKADPKFTDINTQDNPPAASWSTVAGIACCQMSADADTGIVNALLIKLRPSVTAGNVIAVHGTPTYINAVDYSTTEVAIAMIYPELGLVTWIMPGDPQSSLKASNPVIMTLYLDPKDWDTVLQSATFQGWAGYKSYQSYRNATPIVTPMITSTWAN